MTASAIVFALLVLAFAATARRLSRPYLTAPIMFVASGAVISTMTTAPSLTTVLQVKAVAEVALALILFHGAAQVRPRHLGRDAGLVARVLLVALPLNVLMGFAGARLIFPEVPVMTALLLAAALAPTDSGLGAATILNPVVPVRIRRLLNIEGGLNDGLVTPVVLLAIPGAGGVHSGTSLAGAIADPVGGALVGAVAGAGAAGLLGWADGEVSALERVGKALGVSA